MAAWWLATTWPARCNLLLAGSKWGHGERKASGAAGGSGGGGKARTGRSKAARRQSLDDFIVDDDEVEGIRWAKTIRGHQVAGVVAGIRWALDRRRVVEGVLGNHAPQQASTWG